MSQPTQKDLSADGVDLGRLLERLREERAAAEDDPDRARWSIADLQIRQLELERQNQELRRTQQALELSRQRYAQLYDGAPVGYLHLDRDGGILEPNLTLAGLLGCERERLLGQPFSRFIADGQHAALLAHIAAVMGSGERRSLDLRRSRSDGGAMVLLLESEPTATADGAAVCRSMLLDVTERRRSAQALADAHERLERALEHGGICLYEHDTDQGATPVDRRCLSLLGYTAEEIELTPKTWREMIHAEDLPGYDAEEARIRHGEAKHFDCEYRVHHSDGPWRWISDRARVVEGSDNGRSPRLAGGRIDVTRRKIAELNLEFLADHDALTGLLNRRGIDEFHKHVHAQSLRSGKPYCIALLDLDHFKKINDLHGHVVGDRMLRAVADALIEGVRNADWLARWGGEEFLLCLPETTDAQALVAVQRLRERVAACAIRCGAEEVRTTISAGLAVCRLGQESPTEVITRADRALYRAKSEGRDRTVLASALVDPHKLPITMMVSDALRSARIQAAYQPIVSLQDRSLVGEASLARIVDGADQLLSAAAFIDVARELGLLAPIDELLFRAALSRREALTGDAGDGPMHLVVNLSTALLQQRDQAMRLADRIPPQQQDEAAPARLVIAIDAQLGGLTSAKIDALLAPFLERGCLLAIDEWGQSASASRLVTELPVSFVRIPGDLVKAAPESKRVRALIAGVRHAAEELQITCIAKQIENEATAAVLADLGVPWGQGYLFGRPTQHPPATPRGDKIA